MLRLKRDADNRVSIVWSRRTRSSRRLMWHAIGYSVALHAIMLFLFQVKPLLITQASPSVLPLVLLEAEEPGIALLGEGRSTDEDPRIRLARELHLVCPSFLPRTNTPHAEMGTYPSDPPRTLPWSSSDWLSPSQHPVRIYPVKLIIDHKLRGLSFTNDGSTLFGKASPETIFFTSAFSEVRPQVDFHIEVCLETGKIIQANCVKEFFDKRLQTLAERLLRAVRFMPSGRGVVSGNLAIQFAGTFDTISPFVTGEKDND